MSTCGGESGGCIYWWSRRGIACGGGRRLLDGMEGGCGGGGSPNMPIWKCSIYVRGDALMWMSKGHPLVAFEWCLHVEGASTGGDGSPDAEELVAL